MTEKGRSRRSMILSAAYIFIISLLLVYFGTREHNADKLMQAFAGIEGGWLWAAFGAVALFFGMDGLYYMMAVRFFSPEHRVGPGFGMKISVIGQFYNAITPSSTGGQPMQAIYICRRGVSAGNSGMVLALRFVYNELAMLLITVSALLLYNRFVITHFGGFIAFSYLGIAFNILAAAVTILAMVNLGVTRRLVRRVIALGVRLRLIRDRSRAEEKADGLLGEIRLAREHIVHAPLKSAAMFLPVLLSDAAFFSVTWFVYRAFSLEGYSLFMLILLQGFFHVSVSVFPMPGASGASEGGFLLFYGGIFGDDLVLTAMLVWRALTYYSKIVLGAVWLIADTALSAVRAQRRVRR